MVAERPAHVVKAPSFYPKGVVVELKSEIVEGKGGKREKVADRPPIFG
jgi:ribosomal protein L6P/L9E